MTMPRPDAESRAFFESIVPDDGRVQVRPMFGNLAGFVNGNMFMSLFGSEVSVRLSESDRAELLNEPGALMFEPMKGRPMKEYVVLPNTWRAEPEVVQGWVARSLEWVGEMPAKKAKKRKK